MTPDGVGGVIMGISGCEGRASTVLPTLSGRRLPGVLAVPVMGSTSVGGHQCLP